MPIFNRTCGKPEEVRDLRAKYNIENGMANYQIETSLQQKNILSCLPYLTDGISEAIPDEWLRYFKMEKARTVY